jgi:Na+/proline symporter
MNSRTLPSTWLRRIGSLLLALASMAFYFVIIGIFELGAALCALLAFVVVAVLVWRQAPRATEATHES